MAGFGRSHSSNNFMSNTDSSSNFKVVVRVRPPLKREMPQKGEKDDDGMTLKFRHIVEVTEDARTLTILEYTGGETTEKGR